MTGAVQEQQKKCGSERKQTSKASEPCPGGDVDCSECEVGGTRFLSEAACTRVKEMSAEIATSLAVMAAGGDLKSTELLLMLAGQAQAKKESKKVRHGRTAAQELEDEPEWTGPMPGAQAETGFGGREPEF